METYFSEQACAFLWAAALGAALGVLYDWFRIGRILWRRHGITVFFEDILFALLAALSTSFCLTQTNYGQVRFFLLVGEALGFIIYYNTIGVLIVKQAKAVARFLQWIRSLLRRFGRFLWKNTQKIVNFLKKPFIFCMRWCKMKLHHTPRRKRRLETKDHRKKQKGKKGKKNESGR